MVQNIVSFLGLDALNLSQTQEMIISLIIGVIIFEFVLDLIRFVLYYIARR